MTEDMLYSLIGRLFVDLRASHARIEQLQARIADLTPGVVADTTGAQPNTEAPPPPSAEVQ